MNDDNTAKKDSTEHVQSSAVERLVMPQPLVDICKSFPFIPYSRCVNFPEDFPEMSIVEWQDGGYFEIEYYEGDISIMHQKDGKTKHWIIYDIKPGKLSKKEKGNDF